MTRTFLTEFNALYSIEIYMNAKRKAEFAHTLAPNTEDSG